MAEAACLTASAYHPRRARDSSLYRLAETHDETFKQLYDERFAERYGAWRAAIERTLFAFLDYGIEARGFARGARARRMVGAGERRASGDSELDALASSQRARRRQWARLIAFILNPAVIRKILQHRPRPEPRAHAPPPGWQGVSAGGTHPPHTLAAPTRGQHGGACRRMSGPASSLPTWGAAISDPADPCAPLRWPGA